MERSGGAGGAKRSAGDIGLSTVYFLFNLALFRALDISQHTKTQYTQFNFQLLKHYYSTTITDRERSHMNALGLARSDWGK